jgi:hypothetical protein
MGDETLPYLLTVISPARKEFQQFPVPEEVSVAESQGKEVISFASFSLGDWTIVDNGTQLAKRASQ